jgi:hypothetical protein
VDLLTIENHLPHRRAQKAGERSKQGGLSARIRADDGGHFAIGDGDVEAVDDHVAVVVDSDAVCSKARLVGFHQSAPVRACRVSSHSR